MDPQERLQALKSVRLFERIPEARLSALGEFLTPLEFADGAVIFEEGSRGDSLYFVAQGRVGISKRIRPGQSKDLALLGPGDCFGEMALVDEAPRSAQALACGPVRLLRLHREDMNRWLAKHPELAVDFFAHLVQTLAQRLRRTSSELAIIYDLSRMFLEPWPNGKALLAQALDRVVPQLEGDWSAAAYLFNVFNEELDLAARQGPFDFSRLPRSPAPQARSAWLDGQVFFASLPGDKRPHGHLLFHCESPLSEDQRAELGRSLTTVAQLLASALENVAHRVEDGLRERLKRKTSHGAYF